MTIEELAQASAIERSQYFRVASAQLNLAAAIVEKDFWVCWLLARIFSLPPENAFTFKGGTSLSKVFRAIQRFSEDIDLSIDRANLGYPDNAYFLEGSRNERQRRVAALRVQTQEYANDVLRPILAEAIAAANFDDWELAPDPTDPNRLVFIYPNAGLGPLSYVTQSVAIDWGSGDTWPHAAHQIRPYVAEVPQTQLTGSVTVRTLDAARTFWEKATILHELAHRPNDRPFPIRYSRYYYDVAMMCNGPIGAAALEQIQMLTDVATFKATFFSSPRATLRPRTTGQPAAPLRRLPARRTRGRLQRNAE